MKSRVRVQEREVVEKPGPRLRDRHGCRQVPLGREGVAEAAVDRVVGSVPGARRHDDDDMTLPERLVLRAHDASDAGSGVDEPLVADNGERPRGNAGAYA